MVKPGMDHITPRLILSPRKHTQDTPPPASVVGPELHIFNGRGSLDGGRHGGLTIPPLGGVARVQHVAAVLVLAVLEQAQDASAALALARSGRALRGLG